MILNWWLVDLGFFDYFLSQKKMARLSATQTGDSPQKRVAIAEKRQEGLTCQNILLILTHAFYRCFNGA